MKLFFSPIQTSTQAPSQSMCLLSGDTAEIAAPNAFQVQPGASYMERECDARSIPGEGSTRYPAGGEPPRYPPSTDPYPADPRPYPPTIRDPYTPNRIDNYPPLRDPYPTSARDPYPVSRYPATSRDPFTSRDRDYYPPRDYTYNRLDAYPSRDPYHRDDRYPYNTPPYSSLRDPYPSSYPGGSSPDPGNYLDPELSPYRCRYTVTYEKVYGYTYNGARK